MEKERGKKKRQNNRILEKYRTNCFGIIEVGKGGGRQNNRILEKVQNEMLWEKLSRNGRKAKQEYIRGVS
jgi:hypothetical protein